MPTQSIRTAGLLGLGKMGGPMPRHLVARGWTVVGYDPAAQACRQAAAHGAKIAPSARELARATS